MMKIKVYDRVFEMTKANMCDSGLELMMNEKVFHNILNKNPQIIDVKELIKLSEQDFLTTIYLRCLNRLPDASACGTLDENASKEAIKDWKYRICHAINDSEEFSTFDKKIVGLEKYKKREKQKRDYKEMWEQMKRWWHRHIFEPIWTRTPKLLKNCMRAICGKEPK